MFFSTSLYPPLPLSLTSRVGRRAAMAAVAHLGSTVSTWAVQSVPGQYSQFLGSTVTLAVHSVPEQCKGHPPALPLHHQLLDLGLQDQAAGQGGVSHKPHLPPPHTPAPLSQSTARGSSSGQPSQQRYRISVSGQGLSSAVVPSQMSFSCFWLKQIFMTGFSYLSGTLHRTSWVSELGCQELTSW